MRGIELHCRDPNIGGHVVEVERTIAARPSVLSATSSNFVALRWRHHFEIDLIYQELVVFVRYSKVRFTLEYGLIRAYLCLRRSRTCPIRAERS